MWSKLRRPEPARWSIRRKLLLVQTDAMKRELILEEWRRAFGVTE